MKAWFTEYAFCKWNTDLQVISTPKITWLKALLDSSDLNALDLSLDHLTEDVAYRIHSLKGNHGLLSYFDAVYAE